MGRINKHLLPIKAHFFFFMAGKFYSKRALYCLLSTILFVSAMGPILPQLSVYGKELGISSVVMGSVTGILPILFLIAKPAFGLLVDVCHNYRKSIFMGLIIATSCFYALLYFIPTKFVTTYRLEDVVCSEWDTCNVAVSKNIIYCKTHF